MTGVYTSITTAAESVRHRTSKMIEIGMLKVNYAIG